MSYNVDSGITKPEDLAGKKLGVAEYQQTAALWIRGILEHDFGVSQYKIHWYMERSEEMSHGGATGFKPPAGHFVQPHRAEQEPGFDSARQRIGRRPCRQPICASGEHAGSLKPYRRQKTIGAKYRPLFPDRIAEGARFYKKHGFLPVNHAYIIRGDIYKKYPWVAFNLYAGFVKAKAVAKEKLLEQIPSALFFGADYLSMTREMIGDDPFPYGVKANQAMLDTITGYSHEQGLTPRQMKAEELFAEQTLGL